MNSSGPEDRCSRHGRVTSTIFPEMVGHTIAVTTAASTSRSSSPKTMVGHKLGEFAPTRTFRGHADNRGVRLGLWPTEHRTRRTRSQPRAIAPATRRSRPRRNEAKQAEANRERRPRRSPKPKRAPRKEGRAQHKAKKKDTAAEETTSSREGGRGGRREAQARAAQEAGRREGRGRRPTRPPRRGTPSRARAAPRGGREPRRARSHAAEAEAAKPEKPAPRRKRDEEALTGGRPLVRAQAKYVRTSARKARLVCDHIRGKSVDEARAILAFTPRGVAHDLEQAPRVGDGQRGGRRRARRRGAVDLLLVADEGPTLKRFARERWGARRASASARAHLTIKLTPKES